jgi:hypothetical protein
MADYVFCPHKQIASRTFRISGNIKVNTVTLLTKNLQHEVMTLKIITSFLNQG